MNSKYTNPSANVPDQDSDEPLGDRGQGDKTWSPEEGKQGISNRPDDTDQDVPGTTEPEYSEREKGKRTTI